MLKFIDYILMHDARRLLMLDGGSLILLDVMKVDLLHILSYHDYSLIRLVIFRFCNLYPYFLLLVLLCAPFVILQTSTR